MVLQAMWTAGLTWDQRLPVDLAKAASTWFRELPDLSRVKVPRSLKKSEQVIDSQLHIFTHASQEAYGAVQKCSLPETRVSVRKYNSSFCDVKGKGYTAKIH